MKSKITINIDSDLLDFIKKEPMDIDSLVQDALAKFLSVKQVWVKIDSTEPTTTSTEPTTTSTEPTTTSTEPISQNVMVGKRRQPKLILKIWDKIEPDLNNEFTIDDYWETVQKNGLGYKNSARTSTILEHMRLLEYAKKIIKIGEKPMRYKKLTIAIDADMKNDESTITMDTERRTKLIWEKAKEQIEANGKVNGAKIGKDLGMNISTVHSHLRTKLMPQINEEIKKRQEKHSKQVDNNIEKDSEKVTLNIPLIEKVNEI